MLEAANEAIGFTEDRTRDELDTDRILTLALVKEIEIIGEAAYQMAEDSRAEVSGIHWPAIINMRHRLVHEYQGINLNVLWKTLQEDLPRLIIALEAFQEGKSAGNLLLVYAEHFRCNAIFGSHRSCRLAPGLAALGWDRRNFLRRFGGHGKA